MKKLFFAIYPDTTTRKQLVELAMPLAVSGKATTPQNIHLTLAFIGMADTRYQECLINKASRLSSCPPFTLTIDQFGYFSKAHILWLGSHQPAEELLKLQSDLVSIIQPCGFTPEPRPFAPHITVARKFHGQVSMQLEKTIEINIDSFSLMESVSDHSGVHYLELQRFGFTMRWNC